MDHGVETEVAAAASAGGFLRWRRQHALPLGTPCYNCRTPLRGPWCYACGQLGEDFHKKAHHLIWEVLESFFHADGRLWRTLPRLLWRPASLTTDFLAGRRAPQVPPLRLFLVVLLLVFVSGELAADANHFRMFNFDAKPDDLAQIQKLKVNVYEPWNESITAWTRAHLGRALSHPDEFGSAVGAWAHDFAFLTLPVSALMLSLMFAFRRGFVVFDHLIFSMHSLAFQGLLFVAFITCNALHVPGAGLLLLACPVHLFFHMRGVYGTGKVGTVIRMGVLGMASAFAFSFVMLGLVVVGLATLKG